LKDYLIAGAIILIMVVFVFLTKEREDEL